MTITCEACRTNYDAPEELADSAACPVCEHVNRPRERVEKIAPTPMASETTAEGDDPPVKTLVFPAQETIQETIRNTEAPKDAFHDEEAAEDPIPDTEAGEEDEIQSAEAAEVTRPRPKNRRSRGAVVRLSVLEEGKPPCRYVIEKARIVLGRGKCDVKVSDPEVSREHCAIETHDGVVMLRDLKSSNGTLLNGHLVNEHVLKHGDQVTIGTTAVKIFLSKAA
ncbi:MAG: FHA domain-containing protein [Nitrospirota bacterium]